MDLQPTLTGDTVTLRPLRNTDWSDLYAAASDPLIWQHHPEPTRYLEPVFRKFFDSALASNSTLVVIEAASGQLIGSTRYRIANESQTELEIGWSFLVRSHWGGATNREVKLLLLRHAFRYVERVIFRVGVGNVRSRRAVEKIGGQLLTDRIEHVQLSDGTIVPHVVYAISRGEELSSKEKVL